MKEKKFLELAEKERERYNEGLEREGYDGFFSHCKVFYAQRRERLVKEYIQFAEGKKVLEIGSSTWRGWIESNSIRPSSLTCINISEVELQVGLDSAVDSICKPQFLLMNAHDLQFEDGTFDFVFGSAILHHLNMVQALDEIYRVLKPNGKILFTEPLDMNPVGKFVRYYTEKARTVDEQPIRICDIVEMKKRFDTQLFYEEFFSVPLGVISKLLFKDRSNGLMRFAFRLDQFLDRNFEWLRYWFRHVLITGTRK
jgi:ubiquinone/menaquinone biosynthesis C-methylase UbiE